MNISQFKKHYLFSLIAVFLASGLTIGSMIFLFFMLGSNIWTILTGGNLNINTSSLPIQFILTAIIFILSVITSIIGVIYNTTVAFLRSRNQNSYKLLIVVLIAWILPLLTPMSFSVTLNILALIVAIFFPIWGYFIGIKEININNENANKPEQKTTIILPIQDN